MRINLTLYKMDAIMDGDINELCGALMMNIRATTCRGWRQILHKLEMACA